MRTALLTAVLLFAGFALVGPAAFAQCQGCKVAKAEKKAEATKVETTKKECCENKECCGGQDCCEGKECKDCCGDKEAPAKQTIYIVEIEGMCCKNCAKAAQKRLAKLDGVSSCTVDIDSGKATVTMNEGKTLDKAACEKALKGTDWVIKDVVVQKTSDAKEETKEESKVCPNCPVEPKAEPAKPSN